MKLLSSRSPKVITIDVNIVRKKASRKSNYGEVLVAIGNAVSSPARPKLRSLRQDMTVGRGHSVN